MPYITEKMKLGNPALDRRVKMLPSDKEKAKKLHHKGMSINAISRFFRVNKRLIQFILFPERQKKNLQDRKARGGWKKYYNKDYHNNATKVHRRYKHATLTGKDNKLYIKTKLDRISEYRMRSCKKIKQDHKYKKSSRQKLSDGYVISNMIWSNGVSNGLSAEDIKKYPQLIEAMRQHIKFKRLTRKLNK